MNQDTKDEVRATVREQYANIARSNDASCAPAAADLSPTPSRLRHRFDAVSIETVP